MTPQERRERARPLNFLGFRSDRAGGGGERSERSGIIIIQRREVRTTLNT